MAHVSTALSLFAVLVSLAGPAPGTSASPSAAGASGLALRAAAGAAAVCRPVPVVDDRCEAWVAAHEDYTTNHLDSWLFKPAVETGGRRVFVAGFTRMGPQRDLLTLAYDAATGAPVWSDRFHAGNPYEVARDLAVSPDGATVFVAGTVGGHLGVIAYEAATGAERWAAWEGLPGDWSVATPVAVPPDGETVLVAGESNGDLATVALRASDGEVLWASVYDGPRHLRDWPRDLVVAPDGTRVYVAGAQDDRDGLGAPPTRDIVTLAYGTEEDDEGELLWSAAYDGPAHLDDDTSGVVATASTVYVAGTRDDAWDEYGKQDVVTLVYDAETGGARWSTAYDGPAGDADWASGIALDPAGGRVYVTGTATVLTPRLPDRFFVPDDTDIVALAYDAATGGLAWETRTGVPGSLEDFAVDAAVSPDGTRVYATGVAGRYQRGVFEGDGDGGVDSGTAEYVTLAYDAVTGEGVWTARFATTPGSIDPDRAWDMAVGPDGRVFVTGVLGVTATFGSSDDDLPDIGTVAYEG